MKDCVSLEIAKKLKEAGWNQSDEERHVDLCFGVCNSEDDVHNGIHCSIPMRLHTAAPTIGELLEALPKFCGVIKHPKKYQAYKLASNADFLNANPADALALLWLALKEKNLV